MQEVVFVNSLHEKEITEKNFAYIFETYYKRIYNYIYYRVNCTYTTEDLTSQVFEKIMIKIDSYCKIKGSFEVWMFAIARNTINDYLRKIKRRKMFSIDKIKELISREDNPEDIIMNQETNSSLSRALSILNKRDRNIVALKFGAQLKNKEIGEVLGISESNVGVILYRTMKKLKSEMKGEGQL